MLKAGRILIIAVKMRHALDEVIGIRKLNSRDHFPIFCFGVVEKREEKCVKFLAINKTLR